MSFFMFILNSNSNKNYVNKEIKLKIVQEKNSKHRYLIYNY
jgi:hypothetical protein